jgi:hypothetical protein
MLKMAIFKPVIVEDMTAFRRGDATRALPHPMLLR